MTRTISFNDIRIVDYKTGTAGDYNETRYRVDLGGEQQWYLQFSTDNYSGAQWEDPHGVEISSPDITVTNTPEGVDPEDWEQALTEAFDFAQYALWQEIVRPAEELLRSRLFPWSASDG